MFIKSRTVNLSARDALKRTSPAARTAATEERPARSAQGSPARAPASAPTRASLTRGAPPPAARVSLAHGGLSRVRSTLDAQGEHQRRAEACRRAIVDLRMGRLLGLMRTHQLFRRLGFVRMRDYVSERLGLSHRTAQELIRTEEALTRLPRTATAFAAGSLSPGHARILTRVSTPQTEGWWLIVASRSSVRELAAAVATWQRRKEARANDPDGASQGDGRPPGADGSAPADDPCLGSTSPDRVSEPGSPAGAGPGRGDDHDPDSDRTRAVDAEPLPGAAAAAIPTGPETTWGHAIDPRVTAGITADSSGMTGRDDGAASVLPQDEETPQLRIEIRSPAWVVHLWRETMVEVGRIVGRRVPAGGCLELLLAEALGGDPSAAGEHHAGGAASDGEPLPLAPLAQDPSGGRRCVSIDDRDQHARDGSDSRSATVEPGSRMKDDASIRGFFDPGGSVRGPRGSSGRAIAPGSSISPGSPAPSRRASTRAAALPGSVGSGPLEAGPATKAHRLDAELRRLIGLRQQREADLAAAIRRCADTRGYRSAGYTSLERWACERHGISARQLYYLISLHRTLSRLPRLRAAHADGRMTMRQTVLIGSVAGYETEAAWIRRASRVAHRRLHDEVDYWLHLKATRPDAWRHLRGHPLPEEIVLVPGHAPRLQTSARSASEVDLVQPDLHASAFPGVDRHSDDHPETDPGGKSKNPDAGNLYPSASAGSTPHGRGRSEPVGVWASSPGDAGDLHPSASAGSAPHGRGRSEPVGVWASSPGDADDLHPFPPRSSQDPWSPISAARFLEILEAEEALDPLPERMCKLTMRVEPEILAMWRERCSRTHHPDGRRMEDWEVLSLLLYDFWKTWDTTESRRQRRRHPALERDGWRCMAPGCSSLGSGNLQEHHIIYRSAGGARTALENMVALCNGHHLNLLHAGWVRCRGKAPDGLTWSLGVGFGARPFLRYARNETLASRQAPQQHRDESVQFREGWASDLDQSSASGAIRQAR